MTADKLVKTATKLLREATALREASQNSGFYEAATKLGQVQSNLRWIIRTEGRDS